MKRFAGVLICLALLAASAPPSGVQYDEISRMIMIGATAPPPGAFQSDYAQIHDGKLISENPMIAQMPKMSMPKPSGLSILGMLLNPVAGLLSLVMGGLMGGITGGITNSMMAKYRNYESGQLQHVTYYANYVRFENVATKHVIITDMQARKQYEVDLANHTYKSTDVTDKLSVPAMPSPGAGAGTATILVSSQTTRSAGEPIEGIDTDMYTTVEDLSVSNASGKCQQMNMRIESVQYVAKSIADPAANVPTFDRIFRDHPEMAAGPQCVATVKSNASGDAVPPDRLVLYSRTTLSFPEMAEQMEAELKAHPDAPAWMRGPKNIAIVTERGNVKRLESADSVSLFAVPAGFTQTP